MRGSRNDSTRTIVRRSDRAQWPESDYASATFEVATREPGAASERIGSMAGARSRSLGQVLAHVAGKFQHVDARNREDRLLLHGRGHLLAAGLRSLLARRALLGRDLLERGLRDRRLRRHLERRANASARRSRALSQNPM